jgi:hypothetical protein
MGFDVHANADPRARKRLDALNAEAVGVDGEPKPRRRDQRGSAAARAAQRDEQTKEARDNAGAAG